MAWGWLWSDTAILQGRLDQDAGKIQGVRSRWIQGVRSKISNPCFGVRVKVLADVMICPTGGYASCLPAEGIHPARCLNWAQAHGGQGNSDGLSSPVAGQRLQGFRGLGFAVSVRSQPALSSDSIHFLFHLEPSLPMEARCWTALEFPGPSGWVP